MAERTFDYEKVSEIYDKMNKIIGDSSDSNSIAGILYDIDQTVHDEVNICEEAIYGDLGSQLLLDWENTSSNFPNFVDNFANWSALIAASAGDYAQFEKDVAEFKDVNPLGATSNGITTNYVDSGIYANSYTIDEIEGLESLSKVYDLTGATYIDTGMVEFSKKNRIFNIATDLLNVASIAFCGASIFQAVKATASIMSAAGTSTALVPTTSSTALVPSAGATALSTTMAVGSTAGSTAGTAATFIQALKAGAGAGMANAAHSIQASFLSKIGSAIGANYDFSKYGSGTGQLQTGQTLKINNSDFTFVASTANGTRLVSDSNNNLYYIDSSNNVSPAYSIDNNGNKTAANINSMGSNFNFQVGDETIDENTTLYSGNTIDYKGYYDSISNKVENKLNRESDESDIDNQPEEPTVYTASSEGRIQYEASEAGGNL